MLWPELLKEAICGRVEGAGGCGGCVGRDVGEQGKKTLLILIPLDTLDNRWG
jgi:hypothetical protein